MHTIHLSTIDSTNTYAKKHASTFPKNEITCIIADSQTKGRGRRGNQWFSPPGVNLYVTFYFRLSKTQPHLIALGLVLATSMASTLLAKGLHPQIKWPNDLQLNGRKFAGVLSETSLQGEAFDVFLGIGVNVNIASEDLEAVGQPATSLRLETGHTWDRTEILHNLQEQFERDLALFKKQGFAPFHALCERLLAYKGEQVRCLEGAQEWLGTCHSLASDGRLQLKLSDGSLHTLSTGEVHLRRI
jgi:BirA family biotin operon repressor/biotin-[acetyl-CoA-carboxylase] ligase